MIKIPGQLVIQRKSGRFGSFSVGTLNSTLGNFAVKNAEFDQYPEGKYEGEFCISKIHLGSYTTNGRVIFELRAKLENMTLSGVDQLSKEDVKKLEHQEPDPVDEEIQQKIPVVSHDPLKDTTQFGTQPSKPKKAKSKPEKENDEALFGLLWPLGEVVKLDATVDRLKLRKQIDRLGQLGYKIELDQHWHRQS